MNRMTTGLIAGGVMGMVGVAMVLGDQRTRKKMTKAGNKAVKRASSAMSNMVDLH